MSIRHYPPIKEASAFTSYRLGDRREYKTIIDIPRYGKLITPYIEDPFSENEKVYLPDREVHVEDKDIFREGHPGSCLGYSWVRRKRMARVDAYSKARDEDEFVFQLKKLTYHGKLF